MSGPAIGLLRQLLAGRTNTEQEASILKLLGEVDAAQLNEMLADPSLTDRLVSSLDDRLIGPDNHTALLDLLGVTRRHELDVAARAALIHAVQTGHTGLRDEQIVRDLFCDVTGTELTVLKNLIDATPDHNDLQELVFGDIDDEGVRGQILAHIKAEAAEVGGLEAKVLSDIDDTTICTLNDKRFPKAIIYPGVLALWTALDQGPQGEPRSLGDLTFLTARPADLLGWVEDQTRGKLRAAGVGASSMLTGSLMHLISHGQMAAKKMQNVANYHELFPEYRLIFIGDSGQGDVEVGERLHAEFPDAVDAVLIHDVVESDQQTRDEHAAMGIYFFDTYVGAAIEVHRLGLISDASLKLVAEATVDGFSKLQWNSPMQEASTKALLAADLERLPV